MLPCYNYLMKPPQGIYPINAKLATLMQVQDSRTDTLIEDILPLFKSHARITWVADDALCELYLSAAISRIEQWSGMPIKAATYEYNIPSEYQNYPQYVLPLRNCNTIGVWYGTEALIAPKIIDAPVLPETWPLTLEVGFTDSVSMPSDLMLGIFELALSLYELRSNTEMQGVYAIDIMAGNLSRYWVPGC